MPHADPTTLPVTRPLITMGTVRRRRALAYAEALDRMADELEDLGSVDLLREAQRLRDDADAIRETWE